MKNQKVPKINNNTKMINTKTINYFLSHYYNITMCESIEFIINNTDRVNGTSHDYTIQTRTDNMRLPSGATPSRCTVRGIGFTNGLYNINSTNNIITIFETTAGSNTVITLPVGQYNANQLATQIASSFTSASQVSNTYTATYNAQTYYMTITANTHTFNFVNTSVLLGMMNNGTASLTQTSTQAIKLLIDFLYVRCDLIGEIKNTSQTNAPGSFTIPLNSIDLGTSAYLGRDVLPNIEHTFYAKPTFHVTIFDPYGNVQDLHGTSHQIILQLF